MISDSKRCEVSRKLRMPDETKRPAGERGPFLTYRRKQVRA